MPFIEQAAQAVAGGILGIGLNALSAEQQFKQQQKLQGLQIAGSKEMTDYQYNKQYQMWKDTNYQAQMEQLKKAGLNPGLIYGMSGGGGATTGAGATTTPQGHIQQSDVTGMGIASAQMGLLEAQRKNIEADTENKKAQTGVAGATVGKLGAETDSIIQGIDNAKLQNVLMQGQKSLQEIEIKFQNRSLENRIQMITETVEKVNQEGQLLSNQREVSDETKRDAIKRIKAEAIGELLKNIALGQNVIESKERVMNLKMDYRAKAQSIMQNWDKIGLEGRRQVLGEFLGGNNQNEDLLQKALNGIQKLIDIQ